MILNPLIPTYISIAFLIAFCFPVYMIADIVKRYVKPEKGTVTFYGIIAFYIVYLILVALASINGLFDAVTLPPKIIQLTTLPLLVFLVVLVFNTGFYKSFLKNVPVDQLILLHRFRLIGSFFLILALLQLLPATFAAIAGIGDITTALSSFWVARLIKDRKMSAQKIALFWNTFGLIDILLTSAMAMVLTKISIDTGALGVDILASFPFCFIPAFAPATIIFLHLSIYRKLLTKKIR